MTPQRKTPKQVSIKDVAAHCGVHFVTVSRALRDDPRVRATTAEAIRVAAKELGYDAAAGYAGQRLASRAHGSRVMNNVVAMFFPPNFVRSTYFADMFEGIIEVLTPARYTLHVVPTYDPEHPEVELEELPPVLRRGEIDGAIITHFPHHFQDVLEQLQSVPSFAGRPIISLIDRLPGCLPVLTDDEGGMYSLMSHLLDLGHRHFLHCYKPDDEMYAASSRHRGMCRAMVDHGLDPETHLHFHSLNWKTTLHHRIRRPLEVGLAQTPAVTAVVAPNDFYAIQAAGILRDMGRSIPGDISLVGFDDILPLPDADGENILTTVHLPLVDVGREAARRLLTAIQDEAEVAEAPPLPATLVVRSSTAPPA